MEKSVIFKNCEKNSIKAEYDFLPSEIPEFYPMLSPLLAISVPESR